MSPFFTIYGAGLLILQYLSGFKIAFNDMNFTVSNKTMKQIGIRIDDFQPAMNSLLIKVKKKQIQLELSFHFLVVLYDDFLVNSSTIYQRKTCDERRTRRRLDIFENFLRKKLSRKTN